MDKKEILKSLSKKSGGEIYLGVVGAVRTGKSTFIKKCIETLILPNIEDEYEKKRYMDEIPQTSQGKQIMTIEPKFVPSNGANINLDGMSVNIKLVDCVGYITPEAIGYEDELGNPRMIKTPWFIEELPFVEAAELGTEKVIKDHATIGIVITTDGSIGELSRQNYIKAEEKVINELKTINKPFIVIMNTTHPRNNETINLCESLKEEHNVPVIPLSIDKMDENDLTNALKEALYEFPIDKIEFNIPDWVCALKSNHDLKKEFLSKMKESIVNIDKVRDIEKINLNLIESDKIKNAFISNLNSEDSEVTITLEAKDELYEEVLNEIVGKSINSKGDLIRVFQDYSDGKNEYDSIKGALKQVYQTGYGIVLPRLCDMKLDEPQVIKQGGRYGVKLKATASSIHIKHTKSMFFSLYN